MKIGFRFKTRMGMQVATAIAEEIQNNTAYGREFCQRRDREVRPVLLSVKNDTFRFEGGTVVSLNMVELSKFDECWRDNPEEWVVTHATVRYYKLDRSCARVSNQKVEEVWDHEKLLALKEVRGWWHPHVRDIASIKGRVCIFWDTGTAEGYLDVDPDYNQNGHSTLVDSVPYSRFVEGDLDRAKEKGRRLLDALYAE